MVVVIIIIIIIIIILCRYVHGRVGIDHLPENIMMGKTAAVVKMQVAVAEDKKGDGGVVSLQDIGRKLAMHVVSQICCS